MIRLLTVEGSPTNRWFGAIAAAVLGAILALAMFAAPQQAQAATDIAVGTVAQADMAAAASAPAKASAASVKKTAVKNAKAIIKKAKATSGSSKSKLKKIFNYICKDKKKYKGTYTYGDYIGYWYLKVKGETYASPLPPTTMKGLYTQYAVDMQKKKKGSCYHYAALFAVTAKQALGNKATVKVVCGKTNGFGNDDQKHSWVEVKLGSKTYIYDPTLGRYYSVDVAKESGKYGKYCGTLKSSLKKTYYNYKGAKYTTVKL